MSGGRTRSCVRTSVRPQDRYRILNIFSARDLQDVVSSGWSCVVFSCKSACKIGNMRLVLVVSVSVMTWLSSA